ncbi:MAG: methyltransferase domain-containing protein [Proteobacteria bacterium]|nr:methyltransferase domain-containing protein [Pseudomonadota bacterium]
MNPRLLPLLVCPLSKAPLTLKDAIYAPSGAILSGRLVTRKNPRVSYPILNGVPRFTGQTSITAASSVHSFGEQWNYFNFDKFRAMFEKHTIGNTFGSFSFLKGKTVVDAGAGAGMQTRWLAENGAAHVIALELSHTVDGILAQNLAGLGNVDVIQCSIDAIPLKNGAIPGIVMCSNVIQHTPSVKATATELWRITAPGAEFCWNVYTRDDSTLGRRLRYKLYSTTRAVVARLPFVLRLAYAHAMAGLRFVPGLGWLLERADLMRRGDVPVGTGLARLRALYLAGLVNTFDYFGAHQYQHHLSFAQIKAIMASFRPKPTALNGKAFFVSPQPIGILLRLKKPR